ncbi:hypothetical protein K402DRAFT_3101 [Aulographum hederae CBS 113979]|uniref:Myb-like domain-containing protein n=1 Tax=Aulographum hederae CBS 113979 TaxID=1176131 RepID=A0A6G1HGY2_9PEZI|nr:hypothetical protein K402DRAFT_3101 [Aulographum hederae CBS 113979]
MASKFNPGPSPDLQDTANPPSHHNARDTSTARDASNAPGRRRTSPATATADTTTQDQFAGSLRSALLSIDDTRTPTPTAAAEKPGGGARDSTRLFPPTQPHNVAGSRVVSRSNTLLIFENSTVHDAFLSEARPSNANSEVTDESDDEDIASSPDPSFPDARSIPSKKRKRSLSAESATEYNSSGKRRVVQKDKTLKNSDEVYFNQDYLDIFNDTVAAANPRHIDRDLDPLEDSQVGYTDWTGTEKNIFFTALGKLGKHDLPGLASAVRTKGVLEVQEYLLLLKEANFQNHVEKSHPDLWGLWHFPAATEVGKEVTEKLSSAGLDLARLQESSERKDEMKKFDADTAVLDSETAWRMALAGKYEKSFRYSQWDDLDKAHDNSQADAEPGAADSESSSSPQSGDEGAHGPFRPSMEKRLEQVNLSRSSCESGETEKEEDARMTQGLDKLPPIPAAYLLKLETFIKLSTTVFMNAGTPGNFRDRTMATADNWTNVRTLDEGSPAITRTAFEDFHHLAVIFTRKLVSATLFQAMSRIRATAVVGRERELLVHPEDVRAAVDVLGIKRDRKELLALTARKCGVAVWDWVLKSHSGRDFAQRKGDSRGRWRRYKKFLSHDEVEDRLLPKESRYRSQEPRAWVRQQKARSPVAGNGHDGVVDGKEREDTDDEEALEGMAEDDANSETSNEVNHLEHEIDAFTNRIDRNARRREERKLMKMLGLPHRRASPEVEEGKPPVLSRRALKDLVDWRDKVETMPEWELYGKFGKGDRAVTPENKKTAVSADAKTKVYGYEPVGPHISIADFSSSSEEEEPDPPQPTAEDMDVDIRSVSQASSGSSLEAQSAVEGSPFPMIYSSDSDMDEAKQGANDEGDDETDDDAEAESDEGESIVKIKKEPEQTDESDEGDA